MGARPMARLIQDTIRRALADELLFGKLANGGRVTIDVDDKNRGGLNTPSSTSPRRPLGRGERGAGYIRKNARGEVVFVARGGRGCLIALFSGCQRYQETAAKRPFSLRAGGRGPSGGLICCRRLQRMRAADRFALPASCFSPAPNPDQRGVRASLGLQLRRGHGTNGARAAPGATLPGIAGRPAAEIVQAMKEFKEGKRPATLMHQIAKGYSDAEIAAIAAYFAEAAALGRDTMRCIAGIS